MVSEALGDFTHGWQLAPSGRQVIPNVGHYPRVMWKEVDR